MRTKMGFSGLSIPLAIERARRIVTMMTGNANFPVPVPSLADFTIAIDALEVAFNNAADGGKALKALMRLRYTDMLNVMRGVAAYVQAESGGDEEIILSSGFDVIRRGEPIPVSQVLNLRTMDGLYAGSIYSIWDRVRGAGAYIVEISSTGPDGEYTQYKVILQSRLTLTGLTPGATYWIRVTAVGRIGYGLPSDPSPHLAALTYGA